MPTDGATTSATDDSSVGLGNRDDPLGTDTDSSVEGQRGEDDADERAIAGEGAVRGPAGGPGDPVGRGGHEPSLQQHHDAETQADTTSGGSAHSEAAAAERRRESGR